MFISGGPGRRIKDPFVRKMTYPIAVFLLALFAVTMAYGLLGIVGLFILIPGFAVTIETSNYCCILLPPLFGRKRCRLILKLNQLSLRSKRIG